jgi:hypothetical protein
MKLVYVGLKVDIRPFIVSHLIVDNGGLLNNYREIISSIVMYEYFSILYIIHPSIVVLFFRVVNTGFV